MKRYPCTKKKYRSPQEAWEFAKYFYRRFSSDQNVYKCENCRCFHLTAKRQDQPLWFKNVTLKIYMHRKGPPDKLKSRY